MGQAIWLSLSDEQNQMLNEIVENCRGKYKNKQRVLEFIINEMITLHEMWLIYRR